MNNTITFEAGASLDDETGRQEHFIRLGLALQCPRCRTELDGIDCSLCMFQMRIDNGIVCALPPEQANRYERFIADYERIRAAEGRGSHAEDFYLSLPFEDTTGRNTKQWKIRSKSYVHFVKNVLRYLDNSGSILDIGAGNCWMSFRLALSGFSPTAVDLLTNQEDGLGAAIHFSSHLARPIQRFQATATHLPFQNGQFDAIIFNASFHYSEDYVATLREALRCLKPGGTVIVSDTPWYSSEEGGRNMVSERHTTFFERFQTASDSLNSLEYLTDERLHTLEDELSIRWAVYKPWYGWKWALRPMIAKLRGSREPSRFRIYAARKDT